MKRIFKPQFFVAQIMLIVLICFVLTPGIRQVPSVMPFIVAIALIEVSYLGQLLYKSLVQKANNSVSDIMVMVYALLLSWELGATQYDVLNRILFPAPENVFALFQADWRDMLFNASYSMELLIVGYLGGILLGTLVGIVVGWIGKVREVFHPVFKVMAPIPPMVISPYVIAIMPTFRSASIILVMFSVFLFVVLSTIETVKNIDRNILDSARALNLKAPVMIKDILIPYTMPGVVSQLKVNMILGFMMLIFAETLGSKYGLGHWIHVNHLYMNYAKMIAGFIEIGIMIILINGIIEFIQKRAIKWQ